MKRPPALGSWSLGWALGLALAIAGCEDEAPVDPTGPSEGGAPPTHAYPEIPTSPPVAPKRTVIERGPFGNVAASNNLLWDGDFEWSSAFGDQYGWFEPPTNPTVSDVVVGAACRSGVKCARLGDGRTMIGIGVGSADSALVASVWVKFEVPAGEAAPLCEDAEAVIFDSGESSPIDPDVQLEPTAAAPDAEGWCRFTAMVPTRTHKPYFYVRNRHDALSMLVDDAVVLAEGEPFDLHPPLASGPPRAVSAETVAKVDEARAATRVLRRPADGKPNPAREAFEAHQRARRAARGARP